MRVALAGAGAFGIKHLDGLANIDDVEITSIVSRRLDQAQEIATKYGAPHASTDLNDALARDDVDVVILCTPTQMHAEQAIAAGERGEVAFDGEVGGEMAPRPLAAFHGEDFQQHGGDFIGVLAADQAGIIRRQHFRQ